MRSFSVQPDAAPDTRPCVVHVVYRFATGGLENGLVNVINQMPAQAFRHVVLALTEVTDFRQRVLRDDVQFIALNKPPGQGFWLYPRLYRLFRQLRPAIVHSRNLAALETQFPAWLAGVPVRLHGEHGRDVEDLDGRSRRHQWMRRIYRPFVSHYLALSADLAGYLQHSVGIAQAHITQACNGVDTERFQPAPDGLAQPLAGCPFSPKDHWLLGTVGRMQTVKNQTLLARAFVLALRGQPALRPRLRLVLAGEGPLRAQASQVLADAGMSDLAWLPGQRDDVADVMRALHCYALPSLAEGISNTILEAMASGLPVIATRVGGNAELVQQAESGLLVPSGDEQAFAQAIITLATQPELATAMGRAGRRLAQQRFSLHAMVATYQGLYQRMLDHSPTRAGQQQEH